MPSAFQTLAYWNTLSHSGRMRHAYELGLDPQNRALVDELERGDGFARRMALQTIYGSRDGARAARLCADESRLVRRGALKLLATFGEAAQLEPVFLSSGEATRRSIVRILVKLRRREVIDALCLALQNVGGEWQILAPYASRAFLETHFEAAFARSGSADWVRLARHHPRLALEKLLQRAENATERDNLLLGHANAALAVLGARESDLALQLVQSLARFVALGEITLGDLLPQRPEAIAQMALESGDKLSLDFGPFVARLQPETVRRLLLKRPGTLRNPERWLRRLPLPLRGALWSEFDRGWRTSNGTVSTELLLHLPREARSREARRHLALPILAAKPENWLPYATFLEHDEALARVQPLLGDPDPILRAAAHRALSGNVRFAREFIDELLERVLHRGNEQDPVRAAMIEGLAELPPSIWREEHLATLEKIQRQALDARDLSPSTAAQLEALLVGILPHFAAWAASQLAILVKERGHISFWALESRLTDAQMRVVGPQILPVLEAWTRRDHAPFLGAMRSLGRRLKVWDEGAKLLGDFAKNGPSSMAPTAAAILAKYRPETFAEVVPQLLAIDASWGTQPIVTNHLHTKRQDLLTPTLLGRDRPKGRFWNSKTRFVLPFFAGFARWNPQQQTLWAQTLGEVISDATRDTPGAISAIERLAALPDNDSQALLQLASLDNPKPVLREASLRVLSRLDAGQGVPTLIEALNDERARIAIYSLRRAILEMPEARAMAILRETPLQKVTVAKEVVRLLGDLKSSAALDLLFEFSARELHRDVRIALLRALWEHLEDKRVWPLLESAAASEDAAIARMAARTTAPRLSAHARRRLNALRAGLLSHPETRVRLEVLGTLAMGASDPEKLLREPLFEALQSAFPDEYTAAALAIWTTYAAQEAEIAEAALACLLPRRRALKTVLDQFTARATYSRTQALPMGRALLRALDGDVLLLELRLNLAFAVLPPEEFALLIEAEIGKGTLHAGALFGLVSLLQNSYLWGETVEALPFLQARWQSASAPELRRLALAALVNQARGAHGWTPERLGVLETLRLDATPLVASAAQWTFPEDSSGDEDEDFDDFETVDDF